MVEKHIKALLYDHDCVIIPEFGGLITHYVSARINPVKHTFSPPSKKIAFNEKLTLNDGLLISTIAYQKGITKEEAQRLVADFVHQAKYKLNAEHRFELPEIGVFRYNAERRLQFEYTEGDNLLEASFGLPEVVARPIRVQEPAVLRTLLKEREQVQVSGKQPFRKKVKRLYNVAAGIALAGLATTAVYFLSLQTDYNMGSLNPIASFVGNYSLYNNVPAVRYATDYVPYTADEREAAYAVMLPTAAPVAQEEEITATADSVDQSITSDIALIDSVNQSVAPQMQVAAEAEPVKEEALTINHKTGRYFVITGGYSRLENAEIGRQAIVKDGRTDAKVLLPGPGSKLFRVSVADYADQVEAQAALMALRKKYGETLWVLKY
ncbi:HU family DNA-binding protein [Pontibacter liquoris]|uniref:HU domain-containing protein n=1 Tax=Pontibacter liquoris TaxID=2905677 RepID=UPI001FA6B7F1|nr:HU family DNA-binding protein [Pontibacter liquoris]